MPEAGQCKQGIRNGIPDPDLGLSTYMDFFNKLKIPMLPEVDAVLFSEQVHNSLNKYGEAGKKKDRQYEHSVWRTDAECLRKEEFLDDKRPFDPTSRRDLYMSLSEMFGQHPVAMSPLEHRHVQGCLSKRGMCKQLAGKTILEMGNPEY